MIKETKVCTGNQLKLKPLSISFKEAYYEYRYGIFSKNYAEHVNSAMATFGDSLITRIVCEYCYNKNMRMRKFITYKQRYTVNSYFAKLTKALGLCNFAYNEYYFHDEKAQDYMKVSLNGDDNLVEAIIAVIYLDKGIDYTKKMAKTILDKKNLDCLDEKIEKLK